MLRAVRGYANMPIVRAGGLLVCAAAAGAVAGCTGAALAPEPAAGVSLAGAWKLDHAASDDPQKVLEQMRAQALRIMGRRPTVSAPRPGAPGARGTTGGAQGQEPLEADPAPPQAGPGAHRPDPLLRSPMARVIMASVARGDFLTVRQAPNELVLDYGHSQRSFTPGGRSVVSVEGGVADQTSGWKGREYMIHIKAQLGPDVTERYGLSADGRQLVEKLHIASGELPAVSLTRVYNPTSAGGPRQPPTND
jgi:hypothetical protein